MVAEASSQSHIHRARKRCCARRRYSRTASHHPAPARQQHLRRSCRDSGVRREGRDQEDSRGDLPLPFAPRTLGVSARAGTRRRGGRDRLTAARRTEPEPRDVVAQQNRMAQRRARVRQARVLPNHACVRAGSRRSPGRRIDVSVMVDGRSIPRRSSKVGATADKGTLSAW